MGHLQRFRLNDTSAAHWAVRLQRLSGLALALFLPLHFTLLAQALNGAVALDRALVWTRPVPVRLAEVALVSALALHLTGGVRLLLIEFLAGHEFQKSLFAIACGLATAAGLLFALNRF
jgi:fumarate reductase subunit D